MGKLHIISYKDEPFNNRIEAGNFLAKELEEYRGQRGVVLGIPRGGIVIAACVAAFLEFELDIVLSRKLTAPFNPELAIGAVSEDGRFFLNEVAYQIDVDDAYIEREKNHQLNEIKRRIERYRKVRPKVSLKDKIVIVTDDGVATGATMQAALWFCCQENPEKLIAAIPVGAEETLQKLQKDADEVICLRLPSYFGAVGQFYLEFPQIDDAQVIKILKESSEKV
jgi:predicted phosphoribosyltransferase